MFEAVDYDQKDEDLELNVAAIVVATGYNTYDPTKSEKLGYGKFGDVYTAFEFERIFASNGPTEGALVLKNGKLILGPLLFVGLTVAVLVIATASLGPSLKKSKDWAAGGN